MIGRTRRVLGAFAASAALVAVSAPAASAASRIDLGFLPADGGNPITMGDAAALGATTVRIEVSWSAVARTRPADPRNPADPAYDWRAVESAVGEATARGLRVLLNVTWAPAWAEGPNRPSNAPAGTWRPDAAAYGAFAEAAARRFAGRVRYWQVWNEPNLSTYLNPQWVRKSGRFQEESPVIYRRLLTAFYDGVNAADSSNVVVTAGTAPYGDPDAGGQRIMPVRFLRELLCFAGESRRLRAQACAAPAKFDVLAHHPYGVRGPESHSLNPDDASVPDVVKLQRVVRAAVRAGRVLPKRSKRTWVTEISWDSSPPDPYGVPERKHADWLQRSLYVLWRQGVDTVLWYRVRDQLPQPSYAETYQSGVLFADGRPKLAATAFRFPLVAKRTSNRRTLVWGRAPADGRVIIERKTGANWKKLATVTGRAGQVFTRRISLRGGTVRARLGDQLTLAVTVGR